MQSVAYTLPVDTEFFNHAGCRLCYRIRRGSDPACALIMLHGLASNGTRWREFAGLMAERGDWTVIAPDLRGHGHSVYRGGLSVRHWIDDLKALSAHLGLVRPVVGGHCLGANLALTMALSEPGSVRGLVLVEPMFPGALRGALRVVRPVRWLLPILALPIRLLNALGIYRRELPLVDLTELDQKTRKAMSEHGSHKAMLKRYAAPRKDMFYMPVATYLQALYQVLKSPGQIDDLAVPGLALLSGGALLADPGRTRSVLERIDRVKVVQLDALHWIPTERPEDMTEAISAFLESL